MNVSAKHSTIVRYATGETVILSFCTNVCDIKVEVALLHEGRLAPEVMVRDKSNRELTDDLSIPPSEVNVRMVEGKNVQYIKALILHAMAKHPSGVDPVVDHMRKHPEACIGAPRLMGQALVKWVCGLPGMAPSAGLKKKVTERLVVAKADLAVSDHTNATALRYAVVLRLPPLVRILLDANANVNEIAQDSSLLARAASLGLHDIVIILLSFKANVEVRNKESLTALHLAVQAGSSDTVSCLIGAKSNVNKSATEPFTSPMHMAVRLQSHAAGIVCLLLSSKAELTGKNYAGFNPFHVAVETGASHIVGLLLAYKANINELTDIDTPLHLATRCGEVEVIEQLVDAGALVNAKNRLSNTALHSAASRGFGEGISALLAAKANVNAKNEEGKSALHFAVEKSMRKVIPLLLAAGADVEISTTQGQTPSQLTSSAGIMQMLQTKPQVINDGKKLEKVEECQDGRSANTYDRTQRYKEPSPDKPKKEPSPSPDKPKKEPSPEKPKKEPAHEKPKKEPARREVKEVRPKSAVPRYADAKKRQDKVTKSEPSTPKKSKSSPKKEQKNPSQRFAKFLGKKK